MPDPSLILGSTATLSVDTNLAGSPIPADIGPLYVGHNISGADAITTDTGPAFPPGFAFRRYLGLPDAPAVVTSGTQLGYLDFRGFSGTQFWNAASLDVIVDPAGSFTDGHLPPAKMRFMTASTDAGARVRMEILASGRVEIGTHQNNGYSVVGGLGAPNLFVSQSSNDYALIVASRPTAGPGYGMRLHTGGETSSDWLLACSSGAGDGSFKFRAFGNGDVDLAGVVKVDGTQVLSNQGAAVANATDAASVITQLNLLLARLRAHGLIAT